MKQLSNSFFRICLSGLLIFFSFQQGVAQTLDTNKISTETELNFSKTEKRGIQSREGLIYFVDSDYQTLIAFDTEKNLKWKVNIIEKCGEPAVGKPEIRYFKLNENVIEIVFGKHDFANVDLETGKVTYLGAD